jgi:hypothetical protein
VLASSIAGGNPGTDRRLLPLVAAYALALWCLQGKHSGDGYGYPFDRPLLWMAERLLTLLDHLPRLLQTLAGDNRVGYRAFLHLSRKVLSALADPDFEQSVEELRWRCKLFDQLRRHMRIAPAGGGSGLNDEGSPASMTAIADGVTQFRKGLDADKALAGDSLCCKLAKQIDKYAGKLFADPITVQTPSGPAIVYPQRTNNNIEQLFRDLRRRHRRRTGDNSMNRALQTMLADTPLVKNLANPDYMTVLLDGNTTLEELFAGLDVNTADYNAALAAATERILPGFKGLTVLENLPFCIAQVAVPEPIGTKSN